MPTPDESAIKAELQRVLSSKIFQKSTVLSNFLRYVVTETMENKISEIKEYSIAVKALGKPADFNPQLDALIRIHAGRLRRSLLEYYNEEGKLNPLIISVNKGSYIPEFLFPEKLNGKAVTIPISARPVDPAINRVAVLPFKNMSGLKENDFMIDGFGEQLSSDLARFPEIAVISYFSTAKFQHEKPDIREVGRELNTSHLITGSIYRDKKHIRISMQLVNALTGAQIWTQTYDRILQSSYPYDLFDDIIKQVVPKLTGYHGLISRSNVNSSQLDPLIDQNALDAVFWYHHYQIQYTEEVFQTAKQRIEKALQQNPNYALGWAILAQLFVDSLALGYTTMNDPLKEADHCVQKSLQLDPDCQHAYTSLTWMYIFLRDKNNALESVARMVSLNERSAFHLGAACFLLGLLGEYELSLEYFEKSNVLNPYSSWWVNLGPYFGHFYKGEYAEALKYANRINIPGVFWNIIFKLAALGQLSRLDESLILVDKFHVQFPDMAPKACAILKAVLHHELVYDRIREGLGKAGLEV